MKLRPTRFVLETEFASVTIQEIEGREWIAGIKPMNTTRPHPTIQSDSAKNAALGIVAALEQLAASIRANLSDLPT